VVLTTSSDDEYDFGSPVASRLVAELHRLAHNTRYSELT
jgi:hypothetical protein